MLTVEHYARIRRSYRDGMSIREISRTLHHSRRKVREALACAEPQSYTRRKEPSAPKLGPFKPRIDEILAADEQAPRKQRHTAMQVFRRIQREGYSGGYDQVRRYVAKRCRRQQETFIPLSHDPGQRAEADFGHIYVDFPEGRRQVPVLLVTWAHSYCPFAIAMPTERTEAILHGLVTAFEFFGGVPQELWWDNPTTVAVQILTGRERKLNQRYLALASHYNFEPLFCMPARGNEKPHVENRVKNLQRRWATPVPQVKDLAELNAYLRRCCLEDRQRTVPGKIATIGERFEEDRSKALDLPPRPFDACLAEPRTVDKYQTVAFDNNRYSVPRQHAFRPVTLKAYVDRVEVVRDGQSIAQHARCYGRDQQILDPLHYLVTLSRKPACLDHAGVYRNWKLPPAFSRLREQLEARHGRQPGARQYIRVLQLLAEHPLERVGRAVDECLAMDVVGADTVITRTARLRERESARGASPLLADHPSTVPRVDVPRPDLSCFDRFLSSGDLHHDFQECEPYSREFDGCEHDRGTAAVESQFEAVAVAHHAGGV